MRGAMKGIYEVKQRQQKSKSTQACLTIINVSIILTSTIILFIQAKTCIERFIQSDTKAIISEKRTGDTTFIAFTICPSYGDAYNQNILESYGSSVNQYRGGNFTLANHGFANHYQAFEAVSHNLSYLIKSIKISTADKTRPRVQVAIRPKSTEATLVTKYDSTFGRCYSLQLEPTVTALGITKIEFSTRLNVYIYLHHPGQYMDVDSKSKVYATVGKLYFIDLVYTISDNTLEQESRIPCTSKHNFTFDNCLYRKIHGAMLKKFGCVVAFLPSNSSSQDWVCQNKTGPEITEFMKFYDHISSNGQRNFCQMPCSSMEVFLGLLFEGQGTENEAYIKIYLKSTVKSREFVHDYTFLSMLAEIGSYTGLLLGVSLVHITSLIDRIFVRLLNQ